MVRFIPLALTLPLLAGCAASAMETASADPSALSDRDQRRMATLLDDKIPGDTQSCINTLPSTQSSIIGDQAILYRVGSVVYRNDLGSTCPTLNSNSTIAMRRINSRQLCSGEIFQVVDPQSGVSFGSCVLGEFTPYRPSSEG